MPIKNKGLFIISAIYLLVHGGDAFRFRSGGGVVGTGGRISETYNQQQYRINSASYYKSGPSDLGGIQNPSSANSAGQKTADNDQNKGAGGGKGLSAWGIVAVIVGVILLGTGGYYVFVFYPYICKRERNYDMIELTNVL